MRGDAIRIEGPLRRWLAATVIAVVAAAAVASCGAPPPGPSVVVISLDTLRADALGRYGAKRPGTPHIDAFFEEAITFTRAYASEPHTLPSHMTLLTSLHPLSHGVTGKLSGGIALSDAIPTLASILNDAGYHTAAFVNGGFLDRRFGFDRGFDHYDYFSDIDVRPGVDQDVYGRSAAKTLQAIFDWLDEKQREPLFLFLHFFDAHSDFRAIPYEADDAILAEYLGDRADGLEARWKAEPLKGSTFLEGASRGDIEVTAEQAKEIRTLYDAGVRELDDRFGELMAGLQERGLFRDAVVLVVADHGEEFLEHGRFLHTQLYEENVRIPMALRLPGPSASAGRQRDEMVGLIDVVPTLLSYLDIEPPGGLQGRDLMELVDAGEAPPGWRERNMYFFSGATGRFALNRGGWKLYYNARDKSYELYNLQSDPREEHDLSQKETGRVRARAQLLRDWFENAPRPYKDGKQRIVELDSATVEQLKALGYTSE